MKYYQIILKFYQKKKKTKLNLAKMKLIKL